ncbi:hypothetical protein V8B97DRAFT_621927 [Scleroderma yunnanense]
MLPLPEGWIKRYDPIHNHHYWVDTSGVPPRTTWVHPYEIEQSPLNHADTGPVRKRPDRKLSGPPPPYREKAESELGASEHTKQSGIQTKRERRHSFSGGKPSVSLLNRGFFGRFKGKVIGTKEERGEHKRAKQMERERHADMLFRESYLRQQECRGTAPYHRSYWGCTSEDAYPTIYLPPPGPPPRGLGIKDTSRQCQ